MRIRKLILVLLSFFLVACQSKPQEEEEITTESSYSEEIVEETQSEEEQGDTEPSLALSQDYSAFESIEHLVYSIIKQFELNPEAVSVSLFNYQAEEYFHFNERKPMLAGSTTKIGLARLYADLIEAGFLSWHTELPFYDSHFEGGGGRITNGSRQAAYPISELVLEALARSDNTAFNILFSYYNQNYGNVQNDLMTLSQLDFPQANLYSNNTADSMMLLNILIPLGLEEKYEPLRQALGENESYDYFRQYIQEGMLTKYGSINGSLHDSGIYFQDGQAVYALVVMTEGMGSVNEFLATMNFRINEWIHYQANSL